jgi:hypothetical protein
MQAELSPKDEVKRRLRMVLVADRCGMSPVRGHFAWLVLRHATRE